mgnify:CR=1 FL=1
MIKYNLVAKRKLRYITSTQVDHVLEFGEVVTQKIKTRGGGLRLCAPRRKTNILKKFEFNDETIYIRYKRNADYIIIIDIIKLYAKKRGDG